MNLANVDMVYLFMLHSNSKVLIATYPPYCGQCGSDGGCCTTVSERWKDHVRVMCHVHGSVHTVMLDEQH